jgi:hypothetical protein
VQAQFAGAAGQLAGQCRPIEATLQAGPDDAAGHGVEHDPGLGLAQVGRVEPRGPGVVRMDLHAQPLLSVEQLEQ